MQCCCTCESATKYDNRCPFCGDVSTVLALAKGFLEVWNLVGPAAPTQNIMGRSLASTMRAAKLRTDFSFRETVQPTQMYTMSSCPNWEMS